MLGAPSGEGRELDVVFGPGPLGLQLKEVAVTTAREGLKYASEVTSVTEGGAAEGQGVEEGWIVVGINGEKYLSHAHTVATLKHGKRPVTVRFRTDQP